MKKVLIIGCTDITKLLVPALINMESELTDICVTSRDKSQANEYRTKYAGSKVRIMAAGVDLSNEDATLMMVRIFGPDLIINLAPDEYAMNAMKIATEIGAAYLDNALLADSSDMLLSKQFEMFGEFREKKLTAVVGCSYNPAGITSIIRNTLNTKLDSIDLVDIVEIGTPAEFTIYSDPLGLLDVPETSDEEVAADALVIDNGQPVSVPARALKTEMDIPDVGMKSLYLLRNSIIDDFIKEMPEVTNARYFAPYKNEESVRDDEAVEVLTRLGLMSREAVEVGDVSIAPFDLLSTMFPAGSKKIDPTGKSGIGIIMTGKKAGETKTIMHYASADNDECKAKHGMYVDSYLAAATLVAGAKLMINGRWNKYGVFTPCAFRPELLIDMMKEDGFDCSDNREVEPLVVEEN